MIQVELKMAFSYKCPNCNFTNFIKAELDDKEYQEYVRTYYNLDEWQELPEDIDLEFMWQPDYVKCDGCKKELLVIDQDD